MADILSQEEIDALLSVCEDEDIEIDYGSPEFEELFYEYTDKTFGTDDCPRLFGANPQEIMDNFDKISEKIKIYQKYIKIFNKV
jgi:hypothetical protein